MVLQFPTSQNEWRLDAVGLLAVIGETTTETCVEPMTASYLCLLPRLIPAPQALIRPNRRVSLTGVNANVTGVYNGMTLPQLSYTANQLFPIANLEPFSVHVLRVRWRVAEDVARARSENELGFSQFEVDREHGHTPAPPLRRRSTFRDVGASVFASVTPPQPIMRAKTMAPHNILSVASCLLTIGLLVWGIVIRDGPATIAIVLLSLATSLFCAASLWSLPSKRSRVFRAKVPAGDVVIRTKVGAFLIVLCDENISRELYSGTDEIQQAIKTGFGTCVGGGTIVFMVAVILMGNSTWTMQAALAVTYLLLNAIYWFVALMPSATHWEFPSFEIDNVTPEDIRGSTLGSETFTGALWKAILVSKRIGWVKRSGAAPDTDSWNQWLHEAEMKARAGDRTWEAVRRRAELAGEELESAPPTA